jgi:hypothetical protein
MSMVVEMGEVESKGLFRRATSQRKKSHLPHKNEVMSDLSLPSRPTSSYTAPRMKNTMSRHHQEFQ